jgi:hypothetical protein
LSNLPFILSNVVATQLLFDSDKTEAEEEDEEGREDEDEEGVPHNPILKPSGFQETIFMSFCIFLTFSVTSARERFSPRKRRAEARTVP